MSKEIWLPVEGYETLYEVSSLGRVKSLGRIKNFLWQQKPVRQVMQPRIMKPGLAGPEGKQYYHVLLYSLEETKTQIKVHRLVAMHFLKSSYFEGAVVNHKNCEKLDNRAINLEWCTHSQNTNHSREFHGTSSPVFFGSDHWKAKLTEEDVLKIRKMAKKGMTRGEVEKLAAPFGIAYPTWRSIVARRSWKHI